MAQHAVWAAAVCWGEAAQAHRCTDHACAARRNPSRVAATSARTTHECVAWHHGAAEAAALDAAEEKLLLCCLQSAVTHAERQRAWRLSASECDSTHTSRTRSMRALHARQAAAPSQQHLAPTLSPAHTLATHTHTPGPWGRASPGHPAAPWPRFAARLCVHVRALLLLSMHCIAPECARCVQGQHQCWGCSGACASGAAVPPAQHTAHTTAAARSASRTQTAAHKQHTRGTRHTWHDGALRKVAVEEFVVRGDVLVADCVLAILNLNHAVHQQEGVPVACVRACMRGAGRKGAWL